MKAGDATSRFVRWAGICGGLAALLLSACARQAVDLRSGADFAPPDSEAAWSRYHWYAADLSYSLSSADFTENGYSGVRSYCELRLVAKVLTPEGSQAGTIPLQGWNQAVQHMDVQLFDSSGRKQTLDRRKLDSAFHASGVLIIPRVTRGSVVAVSLKRGPFGVFQYWDIPLRMGVPVNRARVRIRYPKHLRYAFYARNGLGEPIDSSGRWVRHLTWRAERIMPIPDLPFFDAAGARPGLSMVSQYSGQAQSFRDWKSVAKYMRKERFDHTILNLRGKVERRAREICQGSVDPIANARSLLQWVQDNITPDDDARASTDPDGVLEEQRGTRWAIATMLSAMYREMGLENRIALSRAREYGGLDPQAPNPMSVWEPLVLVAVEGREWAVCPHSRQYGWGSYDPGLFGMQAMDLESGKLAPLPPSAAPFFEAANWRTQQR